MTVRPNTIKIAQSETAKRLLNVQAGNERGIFTSCLILPHPIWWRCMIQHSGGCIQSMSYTSMMSPICILFCRLKGAGDQFRNQAVCTVVQRPLRHVRQDRRQRARRSPAVEVAEGAAQRERLHGKVRFISITDSNVAVLL